MKFLINDDLINTMQEQEIIKKLFREEQQDALRINAKKSSENSSIYHDGLLEIEYCNRSYIFRSIYNYACGININKKVVETNIFEDLSIMLDSSRNGVLKVEFIKEFILNIALMGYSSLQIYTEDTYEVNDEPYFGYLRGRYSKGDLQEIDQYASLYGIEVIPCIQTLAHLERIFNWDVYKEINDINDILLVDNERTYQLIENMIKTTKECFSSNKINIGMDEAFLLGMGKYHEIHNETNRTTIMLNHLKKVSEIAERYDYKCMMWSDMFYRLAFQSYYDEDCGKFDNSITSSIPKNVDLIYWDYYSLEQDHFEKIMKQHKEFSTNTWFAGGAWTYLGFLPDNKFAIEAIKASVPACENEGIHNYILTMWGDNGSECPINIALPSILYLAEFAYGNKCEKDIKHKFKVLTNIDEEVFLLPEEIDKVGNVTNATFTNPSKYLLYNDCFAGQLDSTITIDDGQEYKKIAAKIKPYCHDKNYGYIFKCAYCLAEVLELKVTLGIETRKLYQQNNQKELLHLTKKYQKLINKLKKFYVAFQESWDREKRQYGFEVHNYRLGGLISRIEYCMNEIIRYCNGEIDKIEPLDENILDYFCNDNFTKELCYINRFDKIFTVNYL